MPGNFKKTDLRVIKTYDALIGALFGLLDKRSFVRLTVNDICERAQISRPTFYTHFKDKYDLLEYSLYHHSADIIDAFKTYETAQKTINSLIRDNMRVVTNLLMDADLEVMSLLENFMIDALRIPITTDDAGNIDNESIVLSTFCAGGMLNLLLWQIKNKFPDDLQLVNIYIYKILKILFNRD